MRRIKLVIADDHHIFRDGLKRLFEHAGDLELAGEAANGRAAIAAVQQHQPDVLLADVAMPELDGIAVCEELQRLALPTKVLLLSAFANEHLVPRALRAGACGYLLKDCDAQELLTAVREVAKGNVYFTPAVSTTIVQKYLATTQGGEQELLATLSPREREVVELISRGCSTHQIADKMQIGIKTVEVYRRQAMAKLNVDSIVALTKFAIRNGLTTAEDAPQGRR